MPKAKITKAFVDKVPLMQKGQAMYWDTELSGFCLMVGMQARTYIAQKDIGGRSVRRTIGRHGHFTPEEARRIAKDLLYTMALGINPNTAEEDRWKADATLSQVLTDYKATRKSLSEASKNDYEYHLKKYAPDWLDKKMGEIDRDMIVKRHSHVGQTHGHGVANGLMRIMRALFNHANAAFGICEINPVSILSRTKAWYPEKRRQSYIKPHHLKTWWAGVYALGNDTQRDFLLLLLFTGLRRGEAARLKWSDIDFTGKTFTIPADSTKNGDALTLPMGEFICAMFAARKKRYGNYEYVFPGPGEHGHLAEPKASIARVIKTCGVDFTCHDLRRTFLTIAESLEISAYALKRLVNHRVTDVTGGYVCLDVERLRGPVCKIEAFILEKVHDKKSDQSNIGAAARSA